MKFRATLIVEYDADRMLLYQCSDIEMTEEEFKRSTPEKREEEWQSRIVNTLADFGANGKIVKFKVKRLK